MQDAAQDTTLSTEARSPSAASSTESGPAHDWTHGPPVEAVLGDPDLRQLILQACCVRSLGRAASICRGWRDIIAQEGMMKASLRRWCVEMATTGTQLGRGRGGNFKPSGGGGRLKQTWTMDVLRIKRLNCIAMHPLLQMRQGACGDGYPMPQTFDALMSEPTNEMRRLFNTQTKFLGVAVRFGWEEFLLRARTEHDFREKQRAQARQSANVLHQKSLALLAERHKRRVEEAAAACARANDMLQQMLSEPSDSGSLAQQVPTDGELTLAQLARTIPQLQKTLSLLRNDRGAQLKPSTNWTWGEPGKCVCECELCKDAGGWDGNTPSLTLT